MIYLYPMYARFTRNMLLRGLCIVYLFAFISLYVQIPGLFGTNGILPARTQLDFGTTLQTLKKPTLLWFAPFIGLDTEYMLDILALLGVILSFAGFISQKICTTATFLALWMLYYSIFQVGQTFMSSQWDALMVEAGLIAVLLAPLTSKGSSTTRPADTVVLFLLRWLLFRLTFSTGIMKLASGCASWFNLKAVPVFFEIQPLPNVLSWHAYHLPLWVLQVATVFSTTMETLVPCLYFVPVKTIHHVAFIAQLYLQLNMFLTGNHSYQNALIFTLAISLIDDEFFAKTPRQTSKWGPWIVCAAAYGLILYAASYLFILKYPAGEFIEVEAAFTQQQINRIVPVAISGMTFFAAIKFLMTLVEALLKSLKKLRAFLSVLFYGTLAVALFALSVVPLNSINPQSNSSTILSQLHPYYGLISNYHIVNPYGAYKPIKDMKRGRLEIVIEGSNSLVGPWREYEFLFKPGNVNNTPSFAAPHHPRLDVQLVAAASTPYKKNPWFQSLVYRLLSGQAEVLQLLDKRQNPFPLRPPKYIRASKYEYHFINRSERDSHSFWKRKKIGEYFPATSKDQPSLLDALTRMNILGSEREEKGKVNRTVKLMLDTLRHYASMVEASLLPITMVVGGFIFMMMPGSETSSSLSSW